jgi:phenylpropionate dioxygenase-like ring-hydroxylating dioxygenase large terminal subunit
LRWYLDTFFLAEDAGGLQIVPGAQRYLMSGNWKGMAENFAGDHYHFRATHASFVKVLMENEEFRSAVGPSIIGTSDQVYEVTIGYGRGVPHSVGQISIGNGSYESDLRRAERLGPEAVEWVRERGRRLRERLRHLPEAYGFSRAHIFPNCSLLTISTLHGRALFQWLPHGPEVTEVWEWCAVERDAPDIVKRAAVRALALTQAAAGLLGPDDTENFERITENTRTPFAQKWPFQLVMGLGHEDPHSKRDQWPVNGLPGLLGPRFTEVNQRQFYRYWAELMARP